MDDVRAFEIVALCEAEGIELPMPVDEILALEDAGHTVDLLTGEVLRNGASWLVEATVIGEATAVVNAAAELQGGDL